MTRLSVGETHISKDPPVARRLAGLDDIMDSLPATVGSA